MEGMYCVNGHIVRKHDEKTTSIIQIPIFFLHASIQGIVDEKHAQVIAREVIQARSDDTLSLTIVKF